MYPGSFPTILGISFQPGSAWIVPLAHKESPFKDNWKEVLRYIGIELIENPDIIKIGQNIKYEMNWWNKYNIQMLGRVFDSMLAKYTLQEERPHGLKELVSAYIPEFDGYDLPGQPSDKAGEEQMIKFWSNVPLEKLSKYCAKDADAALRLYLFFESRLMEFGFYPLFRNLLMMASRVLAEVEYHGMLIDRDYLWGLCTSYKEKIEQCEKELRENPDIILYEKKRIEDVKSTMIKELRKEIKTLEDDGPSVSLNNKKQKLSNFIAGIYTTKKEQEMLAPINFGSTLQLIDLFFEKEYGFEWNVVGYTKNKQTKKVSNRPSLDEASLEKLKQKYNHPVLKKLLELRALSKLYSTYILGMWEKLYSTNRVHGSFLIHGTVTGRLSSRNPNLQNIPRDTTSSDIKKMFIAPQGRLLLQLDYSQAELRIMAFLANEETMMHWFSIGRDIHLATACKKYKVEYDDINNILKDEDHPEYTTWKIRRKQAKTTNFGIAYEQGARKLAEKLTEQGVPTTTEEAEIILQEWFTDFPKVKKFIENQHKFVKKNGYVYSLFGRKRRLPDVWDTNKWKKLESFRQSVNSPIQGSASDFALFSSVLIREAKMDGILPDSLVQIGTVHDSLLFEVDPKDIHNIIPVLGDICRNPETRKWFNFEVKGVRMEVDFEIGKNWGELRKYNKQEDYTKWV